MKKLARKIVGSCLLAFMVFSIMGNAVTLANNYTDRDFLFSFDGRQLKTMGSNKTDRSKMYMKCTSITSKTSYTAHAVGLRTPYAGTYYDCSDGNTYLFSYAGDYHYMTNWVYENGYAYGAVAASPNYAYEFSASGKWSPDNINQY